MFLARKISRAKWNPKHGLGGGELPADAVTGDLRTTENALSFWRCGDGTDGEVLEAVLAIVSGGDRIDKLDMVWVAEADLQTDGQTWKDTDGRTPVVSLVKQHLDVHRLDYVRLGRIAERVVGAIAGGRYRRLTKKRVTKLVADAVEQERVALSDLQEKVRADVRKVLDA